jgi:uncharacterized integral membrane protein
MATNDAANRSWRTILQGALVVILLAIATAVLEVIGAGAFSWKTLGISALTAALTAAVAYFHRTLLDPSGLPSAIPPADPGLPATYDGRRGFHRERNERGAVSAWDVLVIAVLVFVVLAILALLGVV